MDDRTTRAYQGTAESPRTATGMTRLRGAAKSPSLPVPKAGNHPRCTENVSISNSANQKSGIDRPNRVAVVIE